ncbi:MAG: DUF2313 domain-containing protein [Lachnospiraceae bacterium]|nr:DUF2313 domain-containing protein [Lachnospiraceae bacterium]MBO5146709.1 DUF2313 domain-containing protein [Lachnospiraceae bacterium]
MDRQLIDYLPEILKQYAEFKEIAKVEQPQVEKLWENIDRLLLEAFVQDESEIGASKWESIMGIEPLDTDTLELRNFRIHGRMLEDVPYTYGVLCSQLDTLCGKDGYTIELNKEDFVLRIRVALKRKHMKNEVGKMAERITPLNLIIDVELLYNTHRIIRNTGLTNAQLKSLTNAEILTYAFEE